MITRRVRHHTFTRSDASHAGALAAIRLSVTDIPRPVSGAHMRGHPSTHCLRPTISLSLVGAFVAGRQLIEASHQYGPRTSGTP